MRRILKQIISATTIITIAGSAILLFSYWENIAKSISKTAKYLCQTRKVNKQ